MASSSRVWICSVIVVDVLRAGWCAGRTLTWFKCAACVLKSPRRTDARDQEFTEEDNAIIVCDVISSPPPTVLWKYKGAKIQFEKDGKSKVSHFTCKKLLHKKCDLLCLTLTVCVH